MSVMVVHVFHVYICGVCTCACMCVCVCVCVCVCMWVWVCGWEGEGERERERELMKPAMVCPGSPTRLIMASQSVPMGLDELLA